MSTDSLHRPSRKGPSATFTSPNGFLTHVHLDAPDRRHEPAGVFSTGLHLTVAEMAAVESDLRRRFCAAYPDETRSPHLPFWRHPDGPIVLFAKSRQRPRVVNEGFRPILGADAGVRARLLCAARPYRFGDRVGVSLFLNTVQIIALEARDPRRERKRAEQEAPRQPVAMARAGKGSR